MKDIFINQENFYPNIKKYINKNNCIIHLLYNKDDIIDDSYLKEKNLDDELIQIIYFVNAINIKNLEERYSYIYDIVCDYLDNCFMSQNICNFKDDICVGVLNKCHCPESKYGCCYGTKRGVCKHLIDKKCSIKSISCKMFTCRYLKRKGIRFKINDILLLKYFFNPIQKYILEYSLFTDKEEMIKRLLKHKYV